MPFSQDVRRLRSWAEAQDWKAMLQRSLQLKYWGLWVLALLVCAAGIAVSYYRDRVVLVVQQHAEAIRNQSPWAELLAIFLLCMWAVPPMLGHPILVLAFGLIWGLWLGSFISLVGGWLGELLVCFAVRAVFTEHGKRIERSSPFYASIAIVLRHGGLMINSLLRVSFISGHVTTVLQALSGTPLWIFIVALVIESPTQIALVYMGVVFGEPEATSRTYVITAVVYAATLLFSALALFFLWREVSSTFYRVEAQMKEEEGARSGDEKSDDEDTFELPRRREESAQDRLYSTSGNIDPM